MSDNDAISQTTKQIEKILRLISEYYIVVLLPVAAAIWPIYFLYEKDYFVNKDIVESLTHKIVRYIILFLYISVVIFVTYKISKRNGEITDLKSQNKRLEQYIDDTNDTVSSLIDSIRDAWRINLRSIFDSLGLSSRSRISVFRENSDFFYMLGRYAVVDDYGRRGRKLHPIGCGCIGRAWTSENFESFVDNLPANRDLYIEKLCDEWGFSSNDAKVIRMKSRSVYAFVIKDHDQHNIAVIVFESTDPKAFDADKLREAVQITYRDHILSCLNALKFIEPSLDIAQSKGF